MREESGTGQTGCGSCSLHDALTSSRATARRQFLRDAVAVAASLGLSGLVRPSRLLAMPAARTTEKRYAIPATDGVFLDRDSSIIVARTGARVFAFSLSCPHQNTALRWNAEDREFQCPKHKSHYRPDGSFIEGRATRDMDRMAIRRDGSAIVVDVDLLYQSDEHPREWGAAVVTL